MLAREALAGLAETQQLPVENLLTPDHLRRTLWVPPETREPASLASEIGVQLRSHGAREWQIDLVTPVLVAAVMTADETPEIGTPRDDEGNDYGDGEDSTLSNGESTV